MPLLRFFFIINLCLLTGCSTLSYIIQAGRGQMALINRAKPIEEVLKDERTPPHIRVLLEEIPQIKKFGEAHGIRATRNYEDYVKLDRSAVVWVVSACRELEFKEKKWSFPIAGSFNYLGWFSKENAIEHAEEIEKEGGWDVYVRGANAFSTLGWFKDPVLSTMISKGEYSYGDLVNVIIHESVHATIYVNGQSYFNESLASFVADRLTYSYIAKYKGKESEEYKAYERKEKWSASRSKKMNEAYEKLSKVYKSNISRSEKLNLKNRVMNSLKAELKWKRAMNNATLIQFKTYGVGDQEFGLLFKACNNRWNRFLKVLEKVESEQFKKPHAQHFYSVVKPLIDSKCEI